MPELHHIPEFGHSSHHQSKQQKELAFLSGLSVINALLIGFFSELDHDEGWGLTEPRWIGLLSDLLFSIGWYGLFANIVFTLTMILGSLKFGLRVNIVPSSVILFLGIVLFWLDNSIEIYTRYRGLPVYDRELNEQPYLPAGEWQLFFLVRFIPLLVSAVSTLSYVIWVFTITTKPVESSSARSRSQIRSVTAFENSRRS